MPADDVQDFNRWSRTYEDSWLQEHYFNYVHRGVLNLIDAGSTFSCVLDVGCGTGRLLRKIRERYPGAQFIGVDPAEGMIEKARLLMPGATFYVGSAESLPLPDTSVDVVFSTVSFHHWSDQLQGVREIRRVLRPGGRFILADSVSVIFRKIFPHGHMRSPAEIRQLFVQAGLEVQTQRRIMLGHVLVTAGIRRSAE